MVVPRIVGLIWPGRATDRVDGQRDQLLTLCVIVGDRLVTRVPVVRLSTGHRSPVWRGAPDREPWVHVCHCSRSWSSRQGWVQTDTINRSAARWRPCVWRLLRPYWSCVMFF